MSTESGNTAVRRDLLTVIQDVSRYLSFLKELGTDCLDASDEARRRLSSLTVPEPGKTSPGSAAAGENSANSAGALKAVTAGDRSADLMVILGTADLTDAVSFYAGQAGQLLKRILSAMGLDPEQICLVLFDTQITIPGFDSGRVTGRLPDWVENLVNDCLPKVVCTMGEAAARQVLGSGTALGALLGRFHAIGALTVLATWHPEDLLQDPQKKRQVWEDMKKIMTELGIEHAG